MINCRQATQLMSDAQERPLTRRERLQIRVHVLICSGCRNFGRQMQILRAAARRFAKGKDSE